MHNVNILVVLLTILAVFAAYILGKVNGDVTGYKRGIIDGHDEGRKALAKENFDEAQRVASKISVKPQSNRGNRGR